MPLLRAERGRLENGIIDVTEPPYAAPRRDILQEHLGRDSRVLYIGCGTGRDCLAWAREGLRVVGVDTDQSLVTLACRWNGHLRVPAVFAGMNMMDLGFRPDAFDGFLLETYGGMPDARHAAALRGELNRVLRPGGMGLVVAERKMYPCWWFLMGSSWPASMVAWLRGQVSLDFRFGEKDACEERLQYGLFSRCHTAASLSAELSRTFEVLSCRYQADPRYVLAVVRKNEGSSHRQMGEGHSQPNRSRVDLSAVEDGIEKAEALCLELERHAERAASYFEAGGSGTACLTELAPGAETAMSLLDQRVGKGGADIGLALQGRRVPVPHRIGDGDPDDAVERIPQDGRHYGPSGRLPAYAHEDAVR
ncbi:MAG: class I SAM-dependent methyltransferase [Syntrophales bacterium]|nr:class I SAM-dependent methyltransferase [Syntrophales bacterium]MCU0553829.1 class I SAM-dependent methyltransferase [Syntrophales bacterium]MCU0582927.1 class I SAM-dependent methyltransferase [Syntrophales bacterium]